MLPTALYSFFTLTPGFTGTAEDVKSLESLFNKPGYAETYELRIVENKTKAEMMSILSDTTAEYSRLLVFILTHGTKVMAVPCPVTLPTSLTASSSLSPSPPLTAYLPSSLLSSHSLHLPISHSLRLPHLPLSPHPPPYPLYPPSPISPPPLPLPLPSPTASLLLLSLYISAPVFPSP